MDIYILRHGEAQVHAARDSQRELTHDGRQQVAHVAQQMQELRIEPDIAFVSTYVRAQQTAQIVLDVLPVCPVEACELITPDENPGDVIQLLETHTDKDTVLLVSHQPMVSRLIELLVSGRAGHGNAQIPGMFTSSLAYLSADIVAEGCAEFHWIKSPPGFQ